MATFLPAPSVDKQRYTKHTNNSHRTAALVQTASVPSEVGLSKESEPNIKSGWREFEVTVLMLKSYVLLFPKIKRTT